MAPRSQLFLVILFKGPKAPSLHCQPKALALEKAGRYAGQFSSYKKVYIGFKSSIFLEAKESNCLIFALEMQKYDSGKIYVLLALKQHDNSLENTQVFVW